MNNKRNSNLSRGRRPKGPRRPGFTRVASYVDASLMSQAYTGFPRKLWMRLVYNDTLIQAPGTFQDEYIFNLNSLFDPNRTGTGHQPMFFDQLAAIYNRYRVYRVRVETNFANTSAEPVRVICCPANHATALTNIDAAEQPGAIRRIVGVPTGPSTTSIVQTIDLPMLNGKTYNQYTSSDNTQALVSASPAEILTYRVFSTTFSGANITYDLSVRLIFEVEFSDLNVLSES